MLFREDVGRGAGALGAAEEAGGGAGGGVGGAEEEGTGAKPAEDGVQVGEEGSAKRSSKSRKGRGKKEREASTGKLAIPALVFDLPSLSHAKVSVRWPQIDI